MNKNVLWTVLAVALLAALGIWAWTGQRTGSPDNNGTQNPTSTVATSTVSSTPPVATSTGEVLPPVTGSSFTESYISGFEGVNFRVNYGFTVPSGLKVRRSAYGSLTELIEGTREHSIRIFSNDGAGFADIAEFWDAVRSRYCESCTKTTNNFDLKTNGILESAVYANATTEVVVMRFSGFFASTVIQKPDAKMRELLRTFTFSAARTNETLGEATVRAYFSNSRLGSPGDNCNLVFPVERIVFKSTARIGAFAIEELLRGPNSLETDSGYQTVLPAGSKLNSLDIRNGVAYADFNAVTESGGGSCGMGVRTAQIRQTLLQFPTVKEVKLSIDGRTADIFQP
jgi:hypothetical protein